MAGHTVGQLEKKKLTTAILPFMLSAVQGDPVDWVK